MVLRKGDKYFTFPTIIFNLIDFFLIIIRYRIRGGLTYFNKIISTYRTFLSHRNTGLSESTTRYKIIGGLF